MRLRNFLLDLDGTLSDPSEGILNCFNYALARMGAPPVAPNELTRFIGPPLRQAFAELLATNDIRRIEDAVSSYRERYGETGLFENKLYPGIPESLAYLKARGNNLYVVTSKAEIYARRIVQHFGLDSFIMNVFGPTEGGLFDDKTKLVADVLSRTSCALHETGMIGDRDIDIRAGKSNRIFAIAVTYGFGTRAELESAGAHAYLERPEDLTSLAQSE